MRHLPIRDLLSGSDAGNWGSEPEPGSSYGVIRSGNIRDDGGLDLSDLVYRSYPADKAARLQLRAGDILLERSGGSDDRPVGRVAYVQGDTDLCFTNFLHRFRANQELVEPEYLFYLLFNMHQTRTTIALQTQTTGIRNLMFQRYLAYELQVPELSRQRHALTVLSRLSAVLAAVEGLTTVKRAFKRALMNDLLTGRRRFPEFVRSSATQWSRVGQVPTDWAIAPLSSLADRLTRRNAANAPTVLTCSGEQGLVDQTAFFTKSVASESREGYFLLHRGDFAYNRSSMKGYPFGAIKRLDRYGAGAIYTLNICFSLRPGAVDSDFLVHYFESGLLNRQLGRIARVGSRAHGLLNVTMDDFYSIELSLPSREEQQAIAMVLGKLDQEVAILEALYAEQQTFKRGLMQRLLSGEIEIPEHLTAASAGAEAANDDS